MSLHSHTSHSRESFGFIYKILSRYVPKRWLLSESKAQCQIGRVFQIDLTRAWWKPPCPPYDAWLLEKNQIERRFGLAALVSLTDHDNIEAALSLRVLHECQDIPVSVEWSITHGPALFHLGVHNVPAETAREIFKDLAHHTATPRSDLSPILEALARNPQILIVFNHPCWDEAGVGAGEYAALVADFMQKHGRCVHAVELNGMRPWKENRQVLQMAHAFEKPVISGGDRHGFEPNTIVDLTNATTFSEYVEQVRSGCTNVLVTKQYREPFGLRSLQCLGEMLQDYPGNGRIWSHWTDRVFYQCDDGVVRSLTELFPDDLPAGIKLLMTTVTLVSHRSLCRTVRVLVPHERDFAL